MRKFQITNSARFTGIAEIYYNQSGVLCQIDCRDTNMDAETIKSFKSAVPSTVKQLEEGNSFGAGTAVVAAGYRYTFLEWWKLYDKKINKNRCISVFDALSDADTVMCYEGTKRYNKYILSLKGVRQKLDPENYLKQRAWENEYK